MVGAVSMLEGSLFSHVGFLYCSFIQYYATLEKINVFNLCTLDSKFGIIYILGNIFGLDFIRYYFLSSIMIVNVQISATHGETGAINCNTLCGANFFILDSRRVLAPAKVLGPKHISNPDFAPF